MVGYVIVPSRIQECSMFPRYVEKIWEEQSSPKSMLSVISLQRSLCWWIKDMSLKHHHFPVSSLMPCWGCPWLSPVTLNPHWRRPVTAIIREKVELLTPRQWGAKERRSERDDSVGLSSHKFDQFGLHGKAPFFTTNLGEYWFYFWMSKHVTNLLQLCAVISENIKVLPRSKV